MKKSGYSPRYKFFIGLAALLVLFNLLIANDYVTIWEGAEATMVLQAQQETLGADAMTSSDRAFLPSKVVEVVYSLLGFDIAYLRYISVLVLLLTFLGIYHWGRKIFGDEASLLTLLVAGASFMLVNVAKMVTADSWLFAAQSLFIIFLILYIKQPIIKWMIGVVVMLLLGLLIEPISMLIWSMGLAVYFYFQHPNKTAAKGILLKAILPVTLLGLVFLLTQGVHSNEIFLLGYGQIGYGKYLLFTFLAILPWLGFLIAGFLDIFMKVKKREELAIISVGWLIFGLMSMSMVLQFLFAYLIAKHVLAYLRKPYPYEGLVKSVSLFMLLLSFIGITLMLIGGWQQLGEGGYLSLLAVGAVYWVFGFAGAMGLFLKEKRFIIGGFALSALLVTFAFWGRLYPLVEKFRDLPQQLVNESLESSGTKMLPLNMAMKVLPERANFNVYVNANFPEKKRITSQQELDATLQSGTPQILIYNKQSGLQIDSMLLKSAKVVIGNVEVSQQPEKYWIMLVGNKGND